MIDGARPLLGESVRGRSQRNVIARLGGISHDVLPVVPVVHAKASARQVQQTVNRRRQRRALVCVGRLLTDNLHLPVWLLSHHAAIKGNQRQRVAVERRFENRECGRRRRWPVKILLLPRHQQVCARYCGRDPAQVRYSLNCIQPALIPPTNDVPNCQRSVRNPRARPGFLPRHGQSRLPNGGQIVPRRWLI
jgi:hypothetical protein